MTTARWLALFLVFLSVPGLVTGCGGDSSLSKKELIAKGDKLCTEARREQPRAPTGGSLASFAAYFDRVNKLSTATLAKFKRLDAGKSERQQFRSFLSAAEARLKTVREAAFAAHAANAAGVTAALRKERQQDGPAYRRIARQIGFKVCGSAG